MIKSILYGGVSTSPNELISTDGELASANGFTTTEGGLKPHGTAKTVLTIDKDQKLLFIHKQPQYENAIYYYVDYDEMEQPHGRLRFYRKDMQTGEYVKPRILSEDDDIGLDLSAEPYSITAVGNTLCIATNEGLRYAIFKDLTKYNLLPPAFPKLRFQCGLRGEVKSQKYSGYVKYLDDKEEMSDSYTVLVGNATISTSQSTATLGDGAMVKNTPYYIQANITAKRNYALIYRRIVYYSDGSTDVHSGPLNCNEVKDHYFRTHQDKTPTKVVFSITNPTDDVVILYSGDILLYAPENSALFTDESYTALRGGINWFTQKHAFSAKRFMHPFFIRLALRLYDGSYVSLSAPMLMLPNTCTVPVVRLYNNGEDTDKKYFFNLSAIVCDLYLNIYNSASEFEPYRDIVTDLVIAISKPIDNYDSSVESIQMMREAYLRTSYPTLDVMQGFSVCSLSNDESSGLENFKKREVYDVLSQYTPLSSAGATQIQLPVRDTNECIEEASSFYIVEKLSLDEIGKYEHYKKVDFSKVNFDALVNRDVLSGDSSCLAHYIPRTLFSYNNRLHIGDYAETVFPGYPLSTLNGSISVRTHNGSEQQLEMTEYRCVVEVHQDGQIIEVETPFDSGDYIDVLHLTEMVGHKEDNSSIHWFFYPNPNAKKATIYIKSKQFNSYYYSKVELTLKPHPYINGAYWFNNFEDLSTADSTNYIPTDSEYIDIQNKITNGYTHLKGIIGKENYLRLAGASNPFIFDNAKVYRFDSEVLALSAAVTALSVGQKGQFDLYIFTSQDGVWSLKVNDEGSYTRQVPDTRDCLIYAPSVTQIDDSVLFATSRGIMEIRGSRSKCISDSLESKLTNNLSDLQGASELGLTDLSLDFKSYIAKSEIIYDYTNQEIAVFNPLYKYMYILSIRTGKWSVTDSTYLYAINSYPDALAVRLYNKEHGLCSVDNLSDKKSTDTQTCNLVTRALKLGDYNSFKRITALRQDGVLGTDSTVKQILYASNNLQEWKYVASSTDWRIAYIEGKPYRFFKLAVQASLSEEDVLVGFTINYDIIDNNEVLY